MFQDPIFILALMLFLHIVDDYYLQGILASMKQKSWWFENAPEPLYRNDYKVALLCHSYSWAFLSMLPLAVYDYSTEWIAVILINGAIHYCVDDLKANDKTINLVTDQCCHFIQILITWFIYTCAFNI